MNFSQSLQTPIQSLAGQIQDQLVASPPAWAKNTEIESYAVRQARSCHYLEQYFAEIRDRVSNVNTDFFNELDAVHQRQFQQLSEVLGQQLETSALLKPKISYYFSSFASHFGLNPQNLPESLSEHQFSALCAIQCVSYARGVDRYEQLKALDTSENARFIPLWKAFRQEAASNVNLVLPSLVHRETLGGARTLLNEALRHESSVMQSIWKQNDLR